MHNLGRPFRKDVNRPQNLGWRAILMPGNSILDEGRLRGGFGWVVRGLGNPGVVRVRAVTEARHRKKALQKPRSSNIDLKLKRRGRKDTGCAPGAGDMWVVARASQKVAWRIPEGQPGGAL